MRKIGLILLVLFSTSALAFEFSCPPSEIISANKCDLKGKAAKKKYSFFFNDEQLSYKMPKNKPCVSKPSLGELRSTAIVKKGSSWIINCTYQNGKLASAPKKFKICAINDDTSKHKCKGFDCTVDCE